MSAVSNSVMPRSIALWITLREVSRSVRWPKLLQPRPTAETRRPEPPRLRICMDGSCRDEAREGPHGGGLAPRPQGAVLSWTSGRLGPRELSERCWGRARHWRRGAQRRRGHAPHGFLRVTRDRLAVRAHVVGGGFAPAHGDVDGS